MQINEATEDVEVSGDELIPVSDNGSPKALAVSLVKDFTIDRIEAMRREVLSRRAMVCLSFRTALFCPWISI